jgi:hypothetical protein
MPGRRAGVFAFVPETVPGTEPEVVVVVLLLLLEEEEEEDEAQYRFPAAAGRWAGEKVSDEDRAELERKAARRKD